MEIIKIMAYLVANPYKEEVVFNVKPVRNNEFKCWVQCTRFGEISTYGVILPKGSIYKLIGKNLTWRDEPVKI